MAITTPTTAVRITYPDAKWPAIVMLPMFFLIKFFIRSSVRGLHRTLDKSGGRAKKIRKEDMAAANAKINRADR